MDTFVVSKVEMVSGKGSNMVCITALNSSKEKLDSLSMPYFEFSDKLLEGLKKSDIQNLLKEKLEEHIGKKIEKLVISKSNLDEIIFLHKNRFTS